MVLYIAHKLKGPLPHPLDEMVAVERERAIALAGVFTKAGKLAKENSSGPSGALWEAMALVPAEIRQRFAVDVQLIIPWQDLNPVEPVSYFASRIQTR